MIFTRVVIGASVVLAGLVGHEYRAREAVVTTRVTSTQLASPTVADRPVISRGLADENAPRVDVHGNEIEDAVGEYRVDGTGDLYETHAPDTEVTRLGAPTT
jgi:hypothetical protein